MHPIDDKLFLGNQSDCRPGSPHLALVHACKSPCHQAAVGYSGSLPRDHPHYLALQQPCNLFLNIIDPPVPLFQLQTFRHFLAFADQQTSAARPMLIHCNQGESRAPTLALLHLALQRKTLPRATYAEARAAFLLLYPRYQPGAGIQQFLHTHWNQLLSSTNPTA